MGGCPKSSDDLDKSVRIVFHTGKTSNTLATLALGKPKDVKKNDMLAS